MAVERFWCRRDGTYTLDESGYLADRHPLIDGQSAGVASLSELLDHHCAVLLGEPGAGKTTSMAGLAGLAREALSNDPMAKVVVVDLARYGDEARLVTEVLRGPDLESWRAGDGELHLFLDSLDECQLEVRKLATILGAEVPLWPADRLWLRIACRTADWPTTLESALVAHHGEPMVAEVLPLRRRDVLAVAEERGVDGVAFITAVEAARAVSLAIRPLTLDMLLRAFNAGAGSLPSSPVELYRRGVELLADEQNAGRRDAGRTGLLTPSERLAVAERVAGLMLLGGITSIEVGLTSSAMEATAMTLDAVVGGVEPVDVGDVTVTRSAVEETLRTGLFNSRGPGRLGWAHQTYAEYLCARFLNSHDLQDVQLRELLTSGVTGCPRLFPQLRNVAAWLVVLEPGRYGFLAALDPAAFVAARLPASPEVAHRVVAALVEAAASGRYAHEWRIRYDHLGHPAIADQLRPLLRDTSLSLELRDIVIDIAADTAANDLADELMAVLADDNDDIGLRVHAGCALPTAPPGAVSTLRRLALDPPEADSGDDLKGVALRLLWPGGVDQSELFEALTPPKERRFGAYRRFLTGPLLDSIADSDPIPWLTWLARVDESGRPDAFNVVADAVVRVAWQRLDDPAVADALAEVALGRGDEHEPLLVDRGLRRKSPLEADAERRRALVDAMLVRIDDEADRAWAIFDLALDERTALLDPEDLAWLIERYDRPPPRHNVVGQLISWRFHPDHRGHAELVTELPADHPVRTTVLAHWLEPVDLASEQAEESRRRWNRFHARLEEADNERAIGDLEVEQRIRSDLDAFEAGDTARYWHAQYLLAFDLGGRLVHELEMDLTALPRWGILPPELMERFVTGACRYLSLANCSPEEWLDTRTPWRPALGGYRALVLLMRLKPEIFDSLPADVWAEWAAIVVAQPTRGGRQANGELISRTTRHAPVEVLATLRAVLETSLARGEGDLYLDEVFDASWSDDVAALLLDIAAREEVAVGIWAELMASLSRHRDPTALDRLTQAVEPSARSTCRPRALAAGRLLLRFWLPEAWPVVSTVMLDDPEFAEELLLSAARLGRDDPGLNLDLRIRTDLFVWMVELFPPHEDPEWNGAVGARHAVARWRDALLASIRAEGSLEALASIARIEQRFPELSWSYSRAGAEEVALTASWRPLEPNQIMGLIREQDRRVVRDAAHLQEVVLEALDEIGSRLQGETPEARSLWDEVVMRPKAEPAFSDFVRNRLQELLRDRDVVVNREVQVRHAEPTGLGEAMDIRVDAITGSGPSPDMATVVIEAKGCWNGNLYPDLENQLWRRYQRDIGTAHGVYLVAWFDPEDWDSADRRRDVAHRRGLGKINDELGRRAHALRAEGAHIEVVVLDASWRRPAP